MLLECPFDRNQTFKLLFKWKGAYLGGEGNFNLAINYLVKNYLFTFLTDKIFYITRQGLMLIASARR